METALESGMGAGENVNMAHLNLHYKKLYFIFESD